MPSKSANVKNEKQYANSPDASKHGGEKSHGGSGKSNQGGTTRTAQGSRTQGGKATARKSKKS